MSNYCNCNAPKKIGTRIGEPKYHEDDKILVKNACGTQLANPLNVLANTPLEIASINLDLDRFKRPSVLIEVSGQLANTLSVADYLVSFRLVRTCNGVKTIISQNNTFALTAIAAGTVGEYINFDIKFCDCNPCCDCEVYSVEVVSAIALVPGTDTLAVNNVCIQAIVTEAGPCPCNCCCY